MITGLDCTITVQTELSWLLKKGRGEIVEINHLAPKFRRLIDFESGLPAEAGSY